MSFVVMFYYLQREWGGLSNIKHLPDSNIYPYIRTENKRIRHHIEFHTETGFRV